MPIFVCGTTGTQGGALARALIAKGTTVHSLTRDPSSAKTAEMKALGVRFWPGSFDDRPALEAAIAGTSSIFLNFFPDFNDFAANRRQAELIMSVARAAGVDQVVYTSGFGAHEPERMGPAWDPSSLVAVFLKSKADIEADVRAAGFRYYTILRPGVFATNFIAPNVRQFGAFASTGVFDTAYRPDTKLPIITPATLGVFTAAAVLDPAGFHAKEIDYADEILTPEQIIAGLSRVSGKKLRTSYQTDVEIEATKAANPFVGGQVLTREIWRLVDWNKVRETGLPLSTFEAFLEEYRENVVATFAGVAE
ncbi:hypothetical protein B0T11DRAFT_282557 [Plectosphaerella cucumerina]|uniref:NmrA-like domain-containing protein n=1 Tax=Plectosphaerella cucumerina TaxID=40658 RepID=A0A8K0X4P1_9PEZI|nr:hypothetical protein B0T11DRAFT_282557 [Plectosphaerella cucumerina]